MNKKWKKKWIEALESGKYIQHRGTLRSVDGKEYCCLGVLATVADPEGWKAPPVPTLRSYSHRGTWSFLNTEFRNKLGIYTQDQQVLSDMNDGGATFNVIAEWIRKNL